jgi:hypothetical protein
MTQMNRRGFFTMAVKVVGLAVVAPVAIKSLFTSEARAEQKRPARGGAAGAVPLVDAKDPMAKAVKYAEDFSKVADAKGNNCMNCGFYKKAANENGKEVGTCTIFAGKHVLANAWCASWNKKA